MEKKIRDKATEFFNSCRKFPNMIKINTSIIDVFKSYKGFSENTTYPNSIGELDGITIVTTDDISNEIVQFWFNGELLGDMYLNDTEPKKQYKYKSLVEFMEVSDLDTQQKIIKKWEDLNTLKNLSEELKLPVSVEMEKIDQFLKSLNGKYFIEEIGTIIYPIIKKLFTLEYIGNDYTFIYLNVYDLLLFSNFYYPQIKKFVDDIAEKTPDRKFDTVLETCLILSDYYEHFLNGLGFNEFLKNKQPK